MKQESILTQVRNSYPASKARSDRINCPYSYYVWGSVSMRLAPFFIKRGFSPNAVTAMGLLVLFLSLACFVSAAWIGHGFLLGAILLHGVLVLDNIDGHVARSTQKTSKVGELADSSVAWLHQSLLPVCIGVGLYGAAAEWQLLASGQDIPRWVWPAAGILRCYCFLFYTLIGYKARSLLQGLRYDQRLTNLKGLLVIRTIVEVEALLLVFAALFNLVALIHIVYAAIHLAILTLVFVRNFRDLRTNDNTSKEK